MPRIRPKFIGQVGESDGVTWSDLGYGPNDLAMPIQFNDPFIRDAFGRVRTSNPQSQFESYFRLDKDPIQWGELTANGATVTHVPNEGVVDLDCTTTIGSRAVFQTKRYMTYQPGKSLLILLTGVLNTAAASGGTRSRIGYFDDNIDKVVDSGGNGFFFQLDGTALSVVRRSFSSGTQVDTVTPQASWNMDPMDGTGPSGITIDTTKSQIFFMDIEWLGVGSVRMGIVHNGQPYYVHTFHHANIVSTTYMTTASLPLRYEIEVTGIVAAAPKMKAICNSVISEGGLNPTGRPFSAFRTTSETINFREEPLISIRLKNTGTRTNILMTKMVVMSTSRANGAWYLRHGGAIATPTWTSVDPNSFVEFDEISNTYTTQGSVKDSAFFSNNQDYNESLLKSSIMLPMSEIDGTPIEYTIGARSVAANETFWASMSWVEII